MMLDTADNKIFFPRFYDIDTICSYDNSGQLKFDVDIEMEQGYWNTSSSRLWTRIRDLMHDDIVTTYNNMRQNGVSYENMMKYIYDEQIAKIPQTYYNKDYDVKYAPFADSYIGMAHGDTYEHVKRWLKQRFTFVDTLFDYAPSYNNDVLTIRANTTELMTLEIETYTPVYQHVSWYNGQMDKKKIDGKVSVEFSGTAQAATDQEVLIYGGSNVKSIKGITSMNPNRMLIGSATKLVEIDAHDCPLLADINANKANLSPHEYLNKVNLSNCPLLEGNLRLNNSPLVQEINIKGTNITGMNLPSSIRNLQVLRLPNAMTELTLNDASMLHTLEFDIGVNLQSVSMTNCNALENVINFDLLQTPSITLNNSYNTAAELYFKDTTNLSLSNMSNLERVIFTPNNEYETFEMINVANAPDYKVTTFNCPKLSTFMTTAPYRKSYNNVSGYIDKEIIHREELLDGTYKMGGFWGDTGGYMNQTSYRMYEANIPPDADELIINIEMVSAGSAIILHYFEDDAFISRLTNASTPWSETLTKPSNCNKVIISVLDSLVKSVSLTYNKVETVQIKDYGNIQPNTTFTANSIDISNTQFTDVKLLCTTDTNTLKLPTTVKNFYCDSSFDLDTDYLEDGEYDVVHGELVEPYTTDYEGEVSLPKTIIYSYQNGDFSLSVTNSSKPNDYNSPIMPIPNGAYKFTQKLNSVQWNWVNFYDVNGNILLDWSSGTVNTYSTAIPANAVSWHTGCVQGGLTNNLICTFECNSSPNLLPSSADGSLIFSMYAPSNTVAPASGTWDLRGLEFDNFHTFGMNNDIKLIYDIVYIATTTNLYKRNAYPGFGVGIFNLSSLTNPLKITTSDGSSVSFVGYLNAYTDVSGTIQSGGKIEWSTIEFIFSENVEWFEISDANSVYRYYIDSIPNGYGDYYNPCIPSIQDVILGNVKSLTMPARYDDYNISIKNANISPTTHNTMLYPLLVNEDNPITGKLNYYFYGGKHLSWSFAYTKGYGHTLTVIQPIDKLLNSYEYRYNAFYQTDYEFNNPYEIARYTSSASGVLPSFNTEFTYTYDEIDNGDGTYTIKVYADSLDNLPTSISFNEKTTLLTVDKLNTSNVTSMNQMFHNCSNLTSLDLSEFDTSNVTSMNQMFHNCKNLTSLDLSEFDTSNVTNMNQMFAGCSGLTSLNVSEFDTSEVTNMNQMFTSCSKLTSLDISGFDTGEVTSMSNMFYNCSNLTSLDLSNFDTSKVIYMYYMFYGCSKLTSLDVSGFDTSNVTEMWDMFADCNSLTSLDVSGFDTSKVISMSGMFVRCNSLTSLDVSGFDTSKVTDMSVMFYYCSKLTSLDVSGFDMSKVTDMGDMLRGCTNLISLNVENWTSDKVNTVIPQLSVSPSSSTLYGTGIIDESTLPSGWVYDNVLLIAKYTVNATGVLPGFNTEFTGYTVGETNNGDGTYTVSIATDSLDNLPTRINFTAKLNLLTVDKLNTSKVTTMIQMFRSCTNLTRINCRLDTSSVTNEVSQAFIDCKNLEYLDMTGFVNSNIKYVTALFQGCEAITHIDGLDTWDISSITNFSNMFANCYALSDLTAVENWDMSNAKVLENIFARCNAIESFDLTKWDVSNVTNMRYMFGWARGPVSIDMTGWDTSNVTDMYYMFGYCNKLTEIKGLENFDTAKVTNMQYMLTEYKGTELDLSEWDVSSVTNMCRLFEGCSNLQSLNLSGWDTSKVTTMQGMFKDCSGLTSLDLSEFDTSEVTDMSYMFGFCNKLTEIKGLENFDTAKVTNMQYMLTEYKGTELDLSEWDVSSVANMCRLFEGCSNLQSLNLSGWDTSKVTDISYMFNGCGKLVELDSMQNISISLDLSYTKLDVTSLLDVIDNLGSVTKTQTLTLGSTLLAKLTEDQIAIAVNKGWTVS